MERRAVSYTAFDAAHVASPDLREIRQALLREALALPERSNPLPQPFKGRVFGGFAGLARHAADADSLRPFGPRPIGYNDWTV